MTLALKMKIRQQMAQVKSLFEIIHKNHFHHQIQFVVYIDKSSPSRAEIGLPKSKTQNDLMDGHSNENSRSDGDVELDGDASALMKTFSSQAVDQTSK